MMNREFNFRLDELVIDQQEVAAVLGYDEGPLPEPFDSYLEQAMDESFGLTDIRAAYRIVDDIMVNEKEHLLMACGLAFKVGKTVCGELKGSQRLAFFICSAGKTISEKAEKLLKGEDPVLGYVYNVVGNAIAEAAGNRMQLFLKQAMEKSGDLITNRYSPGYCHWNVADQHKLFSLFPDSTCGVSLTSSALMQPVKSISGVIGIGRNVKYRAYPCELCSAANCIYRRTMHH
jgi:hypothetical protein